MDSLPTYDPSGILMFVTLVSFVAVPCLQIWLWSVGRDRVAIPIGLLMYFPGFLLELTALQIFSSEIPFFTRWKYVYVLHNWGSSVLASVSGFAVLLLAVHFGIVCVGGTRIAQSGSRSYYSRYLLVSFSAIGFFLFLATVYMTTYKSLEQAVSTGDLKLARKRLAFNIEGLGPNNGRIEDVGSGRRMTFPLLPLAVRTGNIELVNLLIDHGADLIREQFKSRFEESYSNPFYYAIEHHDRSMIDHLLAKGVDPNLALSRALQLGNKELVNELLAKGASSEDVLVMAIENPWMQAKLGLAIEDLGLSKSGVNRGSYSDLAIVYMKGMRVQRRNSGNP